MGCLYSREDTANLNGYPVLDCIPIVIASSHSLLHFVHVYYPFSYYCQLEFAMPCLVYTYCGNSFMYVSQKRDAGGGG